MVANDEDIKDLLGNEEQSVSTKLAVTILKNMLRKHGRRYWKVAALGVIVNVTSCLLSKQVKQDKKNAHVQKTNASAEVSESQILKECSAAVHYGIGL